MRLQPIESIGRYGPDVESVDIHRVGELIDPKGIMSQRRPDERLTNRLDHVLLRALDDRHKWEHVLFGSDPSRG